jgi:hypothetical protein
MNNDGLFASIMNLPVIGVAVGLMLTYLIASLVASSIKEVFASVFQWRGTYLQKGIEVLLSTAPNTSFGWGTFCQWLIAHCTWMDPADQPSPAASAAAAAADAAAKAIAATKAAVAAARPGAGGPGAGGPGAAGPGAAAAQAAAAAIQAATAAGTVADAAATAAAEAARVKGVLPGAAGLAITAAAAARKAVAATASRAAADIADAETALATTTAALNVSKVLTHPLLKGTPTKLPSYVPARDFATALLDLLRDGSVDAVFNQVERTVAALPDGDIKRILSAFIEDAANDLDHLRKRIETWFDDCMDRLSGVYKRFAQYFLLALGLAIAVVLNVDSVHMAVALWQQPTLRAEIVAEAQAATAKTDPDIPGTVQATMKQLNDLPLPVGRLAGAGFFGEPPPRPATATTPAGARSGWCGWNWLAILGWLITAFAISLGAPFWFGLLQNVMNLRSSGPPPDRADGTPAANT